MQATAMTISNLTAPVVLAYLLAKVLVYGLLFFVKKGALYLPLWHTALGCNGPALIEIVSAGLSAVLHFCSFQKQ